MVPNQDVFIELCRRWECRSNIYVGLNEREPFFHSSRAHRAKKENIVAVHFVPVDVDPIKPGDMKYQATTDTELQYALDVGEVLSEWFKQKGFNQPARAMSGGGSQLWAKIPRLELTNGRRAEWESRLKAFLDEARAAIPQELVDKVKIDNIHDVNRILKVIGTTSVKGNPQKYPDRPHRQSYWIIEPTLGQEDDALREYIMSLSVSAERSTTTTTRKPKKQGAQEVRVSLPVLTEEQQRILPRALKAPYVVLARRRINRSDASESDWAFLKELAKEGICNPDILTYALMTAKETKYARDGKAKYLVRTIENFLSKLSGMPFEEARHRLEEEFEQIGIGDEKIILCGADIGVGKTYCAKKKVVEAVKRGMNTLIVVYSHALATEWEDLELPDEIRERYQKEGITPIVHLYGITHDNVDCPYRDVGVQLIGMGYSKLFKAKHCYGICDRRQDCLHLQSVAKAKKAPILIAQHEHSHIHQNFLNLTTLGNDERGLVVIDELAQLVHTVRLHQDDLDGNMALYRTIVSRKNQQHGDSYEFLAEILEGMVNAIDEREIFELPDKLLTTIETDKVDAEITEYYVDNKSTPKVCNLLWHLCYILEHKPTLQYEKAGDCLLYRWHPDFGDRTVLILSGTTKREYVETQLGCKIDRSIAEDWNIRRDNLKVIQMIAGMGGRTRMLKECKSKRFKQKHGKLFDLILYKHTDQGEATAIITSLGENAAGSQTDDSAKKCILKALSPTAKYHDKKVVDVTNDMLQQDTIPDGINEIPLFHYGMKGIDKLIGRFKVIWEMNAHYYHRIAIRQAVFDKFNLDIGKSDPEPVKTSFIAADPTQKYETARYLYDEPIVELELEHTQVADMIQTEGRFLREDKMHKTIYRTHNVNIRPYPTRVYKSWQGLFRYEFAPCVPPEAWLTGKKLEVCEWVKQSDGFTAKELTEGVGISVTKANEYLQEFTSFGWVEIVKQGKKGRGHATIYQAKSLGMPT